MGMSKIVCSLETGAHWARNNSLGRETVRRSDAGVSKESVGVHTNSPVLIVLHGLSQLQDWEEC